MRNVGASTYLLSFASLIFAASNARAEEAAPSARLSAQTEPALRSPDTDAVFDFYRQVVRDQRRIRYSQAVGFGVGGAGLLVAGGVLASTDSPAANVFFLYGGSAMAVGGLVALLRTPAERLARLHNVDGTNHTASDASALETAWAARVQGAKVGRFLGLGVGLVAGGIFIGLGVHRLSDSSTSDPVFDPHTMGVFDIGLGATLVGVGVGGAITLTPEERMFAAYQLHRQLQDARRSATKGGLQVSVAVQGLGLRVQGTY